MRSTTKGFRNELKFVATCAEEFCYRRLARDEEWRDHNSYGVD
ncbi:hypothetical protein TIFTF001_010451 [Ficus carica]|uniref:Uncharacterized protein n=1 Tax=Ficus carica TaxID=3494 RepID=A0AA88D4I9_FICCA|nr:hypothetical protein TIFTF001_010451 [Ficus carica]